MLDVTVVVPLLDEEESLKELKAGIDRVLEGLTFEVIFVDDGSQDASWSIISEMHQSQPESVRGIRFARNYGKSAALQRIRGGPWGSGVHHGRRPSRRPEELPPMSSSCWTVVWTW